MSVTQTVEPSRIRASRAPALRVPPAAAFYLLASITLSFLAASSAPTPLYALYQSEWGFSPVTLTVVFGVYAIAVLAALLVVGRLSDHLGRRPVLVVAIAAQALAMLVFTTADSVAALLLARVIQGLSAGAALAAVGAGLIDLDKSRGTVANAVAPALGTATGGIVAGLMVQYLPAPAHLVYLVLFAVLLLQGLGVLLMAESVTPRSGALASLWPQLALPVAARKPLLVAAPALVATWALAGFYASLGPSLVRSVFHSNSSLLGGLALFVLAGSAALAVLLLQRHEARAIMSYGATALFGGVGIALVALSHGSIAGFFAGTALAGAGFGTAFQGAVRSIVPFVEAHERAGVLAVIFIVSYLAMGVPAVVAGYLVAEGGGIALIAQEFGAVVMALALIALLGTTLRRAA